MEGDFPKADEVRLWRYELPLDGQVSLRPGEEISLREGIIVEAILDGESHFGEAAPLPGFSEETLPEAEEQLRHVISAAPDLDLSTGAVFQGNLHPSVDFALWSIRASMLDEPLADVPLCGLLNGSPDAMVADAVRLSKVGYRTLKVKVGRGEVVKDVEVIKRIASATGDGVRLRLDANRAWTMDGALKFASSMGDVLRRIEFVEEPLALHDPESLETLSGESGLPVALDESLVGRSPSILDGGRYSFVRAIVLKPQILGASRSLGFARRASMLGADVVMSASYESGVGTLGLLRFARECAAGVPPAAGLDTYRRLKEDVLEPRLDLSKPVFDGTNSPPQKLRYDALERLL